MITLAAFAVMLLGSCSKINERLDDLEKKVDGLENEKIASIQTQVANIGNSISDLGAIRSNIQSLTDGAKSQGQDITALQAADKALGSRIGELTKYVGDTLKAYATEEWVRATFSTLEQYKKTCDTIAKIDARIGALDENLSKKIADCADSLTTWINGQFEGYYTAAEMDAKLGAMQDGIDAAKAANLITDAKADSLAGELAKVQPAIDSAKTQLTREYTAAIDTAIKTCEGKLTKQIQDEIEKVNETVTALAERVGTLEFQVTDLLGRVGSLEKMIQAVTIVPAYNDGSLKIKNDSLYLDCIITPSEVVGSLQKKNFSLLVKGVQTKAVVLDTINFFEIEEFSKDRAKGTVSFRVRIGDYMPHTGDSAIAVAVNVTYRHSGNLTSNYTSKFVKAGFDLRLLLKEMLYNLADTRQNNYRMIDMMIGGELGGHIATVNTPGNSGNYSTYNPRLELIDIPFNTIMTQIYNNFPRIKDITGGTGVAYQWAQILRIMATHRLSDIYGPVPYSQVTGSSYNVPYDTMGDLYAFMFEELTEAIGALDAIIKSEAENDVIAYLAPIDNIYQGDFSKWVKFANSFRLRMAMRLIDVDPAGAKSKVDQIVRSEYGLLETAEESAWCTPYEGENPIYRAVQSGEFRISGNLTAYMNGYNDPRLPIYATMASAGGDAGKYVGVRNGVKYDPSTLAAHQQLSGINVSAQDRLLVMSASEVFFLRAEALQRGWVSGDAKSYYEKGVKISMNERGVGNKADEYLASMAFPGVYESATCSDDNCSEPPSTVYNGPFDSGNAFEQIMIQKWIANFPNGWETWADIRRTGYPKFFPVKDNLSLTEDYGTGKVYDWSAFCRVPFPRSQYLENRTNVEDAVNSKLSNGPDSTATRLWWDTGY